MGGLLLVPELAHICNVCGYSVDILGTYMVKSASVVLQLL